MSELLSGISVFKQHLMHLYCRHVFFIHPIILTLANRPYNIFRV